MFAKLTKSIYIDGKCRDMKTQKIERIYNPATLDPITDVANGGTDDTKEATQAAARAFKEWSTMTRRKRSHILYKAYELMRQDAERLGRILTTEQGKPLKEAI